MKTETNKKPSAKGPQLEQEKKPVPDCLHNVFCPYQTQAQKCTKKKDCNFKD